MLSVRVRVRFCVSLGGIRAPCPGRPSHIPSPPSPLAIAPENSVKCVKRHANVAASCARLQISINLWSSYYVLCGSTPQAFASRFNFHVHCAAPFITPTHDARAMNGVLYVHVNMARTRTRRALKQYGSKCVRGYKKSTVVSVSLTDFDVRAARVSSARLRAPSTTDGIIYVRVPEKWRSWPRVSSHAHARMHAHTALTMRILLCVPFAFRIYPIKRQQSAATTPATTTAGNQAAATAATP